MNIYTIGFTKKSAEQFFEALKDNNIELLVDVRLNNKSQLAGFTKGSDLVYFVKQIVGADYVHGDEYAPSKDLLDRYHKGTTSWEEYVTEYREIISRRGCHLKFPERFRKYNNICLLCSEATPEMCHRRLLAEMIAENAKEEIAIIHI